MQDRALYSIQEARKLLGISRNTIYKLLRTGELARVVIALPEVITAAESISLSETTVYSSYPKLRMMFEMATSYDATGPSATQTTFFAKCEYSWSGKP